jgi:hypothetical protein
VIHRQELRVLGVGVALIGGWMTNLFIPVSWPVFLLAVGITSIVGALLAQARWAMLAVPAAVWLGALGTAVIDGVTHSRLADPVWPAQMLELAAILVVIAVVPSVICVLIGMAASTWLQKRLSHQ